MAACKDSRESNIKVYAAAMQVRLILKEIKLSENEPKRAKSLQRKINSIYSGLKISDVVDEEAAATLRKLYRPHFHKIKIKEISIWYSGNKMIEEAVVKYPNGCLERFLKGVDEGFRTVSLNYLPVKKQATPPTK